MKRKIDANLVNLYKWVLAEDHLISSERKENSYVITVKDIDMLVHTYDRLYEYSLEEKIMDWLVELKPVGEENENLER